MRIAAVSSQRAGELDALFLDLARALRAEGLRPAGFVPAADALTDAQGCAMEMAMEILPEGGRIVMSEPRGPGATGCRMDAGKLEQAALAVEAQIATAGADLFLLNKFGQIEAAGRGFVGAITAALEAELPVIVGVGRSQAPAFAAFAEGLAEPLPPEPAALLAWCRAAVAARG